MNLNPMEPTLDFLILADRAEAINNKLYMLGGGWDLVTAVPNQVVSVSVALGVLVPWLATNRDIPIDMRLENADGQEIVRVQGTFRVGRPPQLEEGMTQRAVQVLTLSVVFPAPGRYVYVATVGVDERRSSFMVRFTAPPPQQQPPAP